MRSSIVHALFYTKKFYMFARNQDATTRIFSSPNLGTRSQNKLGILDLWTQEYVRTYRYVVYMWVQYTGYCPPFPSIFFLLLLVLIMTCTYSTYMSSLVTETESLIVHDRPRGDLVHYWADVKDLGGAILKFQWRKLSCFARSLEWVWWCFKSQVSCVD